MTGEKREIGVVGEMSELETGLCEESSGETCETSEIFGRATSPWALHLFSTNLCFIRRRLTDPGFIGVEISSASLHAETSAVRRIPPTESGM